MINIVHETKCGKALIMCVCFFLFLLRFCSSHGFHSGREVSDCTKVYIKKIMIVLIEYILITRFKISDISDIGKD